MMLSTIEEIKARKIIAIFRNIPNDKVIETARALLNGGIRLIEVTFNQLDSGSNNESAKSIFELTREFSGQLVIGAGTVMSIQQLQIALDSGAKYIISPHADTFLIKETVKKGAVSIPGAFTPTEIVQAYQEGAHLVKVFPVGCLGVDYINSIRAPISHIPLIAVGGIDESNLGAFLNTGIAGIGIGSNLVQMDLIKQRKFDDLTLLAQRFVQQVEVKV